ncbi:MAG: PAS domain S-box protein [Eubacteriales bacterium]
MGNNKFKCLIVDDNPDNIISLRALINDAFPYAAVLTAGSGRQGLDIAAAEIPDVILLDIIMPGMDGFEVCRKLKADKNLCDIPVVFATAIKGDKENRIRALQCGAEAFLSKPIDESELTAQINSMLKIRTAVIEKRNENERLAKSVEEKTRELKIAQSQTMNLLEELKSEYEIRKISDEKYRKIEENMIDVIWTTDLNFNTTYVSPSVEKLLGETAETHLSRTMEERMPSDSLKKIRQLIKDEFEKEKDPLCDKQRKLSIDLEHYRADKSLIWVNMHVSFIRDKNGNAVGIQGLTRDISEQKQAEEALNRERILTEAIFESIPGYLYVYDEAGHLIRWNKNHEKMTGYTTEELSHMTLDKWFEGDDAVRVAEAVKKVFETGYGDVEADLLMKDGHKLPIFTNGVALKIEGKNYFTGIGMDISERKKHESEIIRAKEYFELMFNINPDAALVSRLDDGLIIEANEGFTYITGYNRDEVIGKSILDLNIYLNPDDRRQIIKILIEKGYCNNIEVQFLRKNGSVFPALASAKMYELNGITYVFSNTRDITGRKKAEQAVNENLIKFQSLFEHMSSGAAVYKVLNDGSKGKDYIIQDFNKVSLQIEGIEKSDVIGKSLYDLRPNIDLYGLIAVFQEVWKTGHSAVFPYKFYIDDNFYNCYENHVFKLPTGEIVAIYDDVTEIKQSEQALHESEIRLKEAQKLAHFGNWELDIKTKTISASEESFNIYGLKHSTKYISLDDVKRVVFPEYRNMMDDRLIRLITKHEEYNVEFKIKKADTGEDRFIHSIATLQFDNTGKAYRVTGTIQDITERKRTEEILRHMSYHDQLTDLYNRRFFEKEIMILDLKENLPLTVVMADINGLKLVNDSFGHAAGDELLKKIAETIKTGCRGHDIIARLGGDEFVVILPKTNSIEAQQFIKRMKERISKERMGNIDLSVSFGYDTKETEQQTITDILASAENHMYRHKLFERSSMRSKTTDIIMNTLFEKSKRESLHSKRVSGLCQAIAEKMNFEKDDIGQIRIAGLIHDIGKIGTDEKILNKPKNLSDDEKKEIQKHPETGWRILVSTSEFSELASFVLAHHERWDGSGYPNGLKGEEIPLESRIIAVADAYDAMTGERSYHSGLSIEEAVTEIKQCSGTQFDPRIARIFVENVLGQTW